MSFGHGTLTREQLAKLSPADQQLAKTLAAELGMPIPGSLTPPRNRRLQTWLISVFPSSGMPSV